MFPSLWRNLGGLLRGFTVDRRGAVVLTLIVALVPAVALLGIVTDGARAYMVKMRLSQAVDSAALAGGRAFAESSQLSDINRYFAGNFPADYMGATLDPLSVDVDDLTGTVEVTANASVPTTFLQVLKIDDLTVTARSVVKRAVRGMELALILDTTGSMSGSKIDSLKTAAKSLIDVLYGDRETVDDLWVSLVPFASRVRISPHSDWMEGPPDPWNGCAYSREGALGNDDSPPSAGLFPEFTPTVTGWRPPHYGCPDLAALPLTAEKTTIKTTIDAMEAFGNTRTDVGMVWGWRTLSPRWRGLWGGDPNLPLDYHTPLMDKVAVLMTDGENTPHLTGDPETPEESNRQLAAGCEAMKAAGITIYTITFQAPESLDPLFSACATTPDHHFPSPTNEALERTFNIIGAELSNLRIAK